MKLKECVQCHRMFKTNCNSRKLCSDECIKKRRAIRQREYYHSERGKIYSKMYYINKFAKMTLEEYLNYLEKEKLKSKRYKYSDLTEEQKKKRIKAYTFYCNMTNKNFNSKSFEEKIDITQNRINELLSEPIELLLKSKKAKAKIKKISKRMDKRLLKNQKI